MTALQLSMYLRDRYRKPVLYLDCTEERVMEHLEQAGQQKNMAGDYSNFMFEQNRIMVVKRVALQEISGWRNKGYALVVVCLGTKSPLLSDCPFCGCIFSGAVTAISRKQWETMLLPLNMGCPVSVAVTGGDISLAAEWGEECRINKLPPYFEVFGTSKPFKREMKLLLDKM